MDLRQGPVRGAQLLQGVEFFRALGHQIVPAAAGEGQTVSGLPEPVLHAQGTGERGGTAEQVRNLRGEGVYEVQQPRPAPLPAALVVVQGALYGIHLTHFLL